MLGFSVWYGFVGGILLGISVNASEIDGKIFGYLGLKGGYSHQVVGESVPMVGSFGVGVPSGSSTTLSGYTTPVMPVGVTLGVGYYLAPKFGIRLEAEYLYRMVLSSAKPNIDQGAGAPPIPDTINILTNASNVLANVYADYYILPQVNVYLGAGMLDTNLKFSSKASESKIQGDKVNFAWQFGGGMGMSITQHVKLDLGVRFINFDKAVIDTNQLPQTHQHSLEVC